MPRIINSMAGEGQQQRTVDPRVLFGKRLRELRRARGHSQEDLADLARLDRTYVSSCERGRRNVSLLNIWRFAEALEIDPTELLKAPTTL